MTPKWSTACPDWGDRIRDGRSIIPPPIFPDEAERALAVFRELKIVDAPGSPTFGEAAAPWVFDLVASVFGAYDPNSGRRLITEWFVCVPKKNSKSSLAAGIMMTALILGWRQSGIYTVLAPTVQVASNAFEPAKDMVMKDEELLELMHPQTHIKTITNRNTNATLKVLAADSNTVGGTKGIGTLVDELWLFGKQPNAESMLREAVGGLASRPEGFVIYLTTQSDDPPAGVFKQKLQYARDVRDGIINDPGLVPVIYEHPADMVANGEALRLENMAMVNPNLGFSVDRDFLAREYAKAELDGEAALRGFMAKHANVEVGMRLRADRWAGADFWEAAGRHRRLTLQDLLELCEVIDLGIDGGGLDDLLALTATGRTPGGKWLTWSHAWANPTVLERRKKEASRFLDFEKDGDLTVVKTPGEDVVQLAAMVGTVYRSNLLDLVGVDQHGLGGILDALEAEGVPADKIVGISQGWKLSATIKTAERKLNEGVIEHASQPMMAWCVGNAKTVPAGNAVNITKQVSGSAKIDPLMSFFSSVELMSRNPASPKKKYQLLIYG